MKKLTIGAAAVLLLTFILDFFVHQHVKFGPEDLPGFYGLLAFAGSGIAVLAAVALPRLLRGRSIEAQGQMNQVSGEDVSD